MVFSEITGVFSGKPEIAGEYIVPVTVETNYGKDTKNIVINVEADGHRRVYVIGGGTNNNCFIVENSVPDEYEFYPAANLPDDVVSFSRFPVGFRAHTTSGNAFRDAYGKKSDVNGITYVRSENYRYGSYIHTVSVCAFARCNLQKEMIISDRYYDFYGNGVTNAGQRNGNIKSSSVSLVPVLDIGTYEKGIRWLSADGTLDCRKEYTVNTDGFTARSEILTADLGYKAIKLIESVKFSVYRHNFSQ